MAMPEFSERVAHFPARRRFRAVQLTLPAGWVGQLASFPFTGEGISGISPIVKRSMDVALSVAGLIVLALPMLLLGLLIKLESEGPVFYRSERLGLTGRRIQCTKFRTMRGGADLQRRAAEKRQGSSAPGSDDLRITRVGRFLRRHSIDALPQLWDVLRGEMSIVGPRPPLASEVEQRGPGHLRRLAVMPGMTGLSQVQPVQDPSVDGYVSLDVAYVENWSPWLDVRVIAKAIGAALAGSR